MIIRNVKLTDAPSIASIYNYYVENSVITFEEETITFQQMEKRIENISNNYPYLVIEDSNELIGYAYATRWKERSAYKYSAEVSIYLNHNRTGSGAGTMLFSKLLDELKQTQVHSLVGGIALPNDASIKLHEKFGFRKIAQFEQIGFKFNQWIDVGYWQLIV